MSRDRIVCPGFVDSLVHVSGGGGEGGFASRTRALTDPGDAFRAGITTVIGALGTDDVTRSLADLLAAARAFDEQGLTAFVLSGSYRVPVTTLTGSIRSDLVLIPDMIGVGEVAIADHRGSHPGVDELARVAADARVGGMLAGKRGLVLVHVGDAEEGLRILHEVSDRHPMPPSQWHPTHINRHAGLLAQARGWVERGGSVDITASTTDALVAAGDIRAGDALARLLQQGLPVSRITMSSGRAREPAAVRRRRRLAGDRRGAARQPAWCTGRRGSFSWRAIRNRTGNRDADTRGAVGSAGKRPGSTGCGCRPAGAGT